MKKYIYLIAGGMFLGAGIAFANLSGLGADPITVMYDGVSTFFNVSIGTASWLVSIMTIIIVFFIDKEELGIGTLVTPFITKLGIDLIFKLGIETKFNLNLIFNKILFFSIGLSLIALGVGVIIRQDKGKGNNDAFITALANIFDKQYYQVRFIVDLFYLIAGAILGGKITIGTLISTIVLGKMIEYVVNFP